MYGLLAASFMTLTGCGSDSPKVSLESVEPSSTDIENVARGHVMMNFTEGVLPFPHDALFSGSKDGTLNIPVDDATDYSNPAVAMNAVDGFSTSAPITFSVSNSLDLTDANANRIVDTLEQSVSLYKVERDPLTKSVVKVVEPLQLGVDFILAVSDSTEAKQVVILPLKPLLPKTTYLVVVDNDLQDSEQVAFDKGLFYGVLSQQDRTLEESSFSDLEPLRLQTIAQLAALEKFGVDSENIVSSWTFTTQSTRDVLENVVREVRNDSLNVSDTQLDTTSFGGQGVAQIYAGTLSVPYYSGVPSIGNPVAPLNTFWQGAQGSMLSQYNASPVKTIDMTVPVLMSVPKGPSPQSGWPVVVFQHGITQNRGNLLAVADSLANAGFAAVAIDMPLHGITENSSLASLRLEGVPERTFDMDYVTQNAQGSVIAPQPDGVQDSSGRHFINLSHLVVTRDNLRQAVSDLAQLEASLSSPSVVNLLDANNVSFVGHSLGAMVGGVYQALVPSKASVFAMPGQQAAYLLAGSASFGPEIVAGLAAQGVSADSAEFQQFLVAAQTLVDSVDPVNYVESIQSPSLLMEVVGDQVDPATADQTIPNEVANAPLAGTEPWIRLQGLSAISASGELLADKAVMRFNSGDHASLFSPAASLPVTVTMQEAMASFLATEGSQVIISSTETLQ